MRTPTLTQLSTVSMLAAALLAGCTAGSSTPTAEEQAAAASEELGPRWDTDIVEDARDGTFIVAVPQEAEVWRIGEPTTDIAALTVDTAWAGFWLPALEEAEVDRSNVRAVVVDATSLAGEIVSWQVNVNAGDPGLELETEELVDDLRTRFEAQGLEVDQAEPVEWADREVALVGFEVPEESFGGEARYVRQWFIPVDEPAAMWSFSCDAPADRAQTTELCRDGLDGFRIATPPAQDRT